MDDESRRASEGVPRCAFCSAGSSCPVAQALVGASSSRSSNEGVLGMGSNRRPQTGRPAGDAFAADMAPPCQRNLQRELALHLMEHRTNRGLSRVELSRMSNLRVSSIYNIETELSHARLDTIEKLARALNVNPNELFDE